MKLGEKITVLRKENYITQEELANKLNVTRQAISRWELNASIPEMDTLKKLSEIFNVSIDYLINDDIITPIEKKEKAKYLNYKLAVSIILISLVLVSIITYLIDIAKGDIFGIICISIGIFGSLIAFLVVRTKFLIVTDLSTSDALINFNYTKAFYRTILIILAGYIHFVFYSSLIYSFYYSIFGFSLSYMIVEKIHAYFVLEKKPTFIINYVAQIIYSFLIALLFFKSFFKLNSSLDNEYTNFDYLWVTLYIFILIYIYQLVVSIKKKYLNKLILGLIPIIILFSSHIIFSLEFNMIALGVGVIFLISLILYALLISKVVTLYHLWFYSVIFFFFLNVIVLFLNENLTLLVLCCSLVVPFFFEKYCSKLNYQFLKTKNN